MRIDGPTAIGAAYAEADFFDAGGLPTDDPAEAAYIEITEYAGDGTALRRTYMGGMPGEGEPEQGATNQDITVEDQDTLKGKTWDIYAVVDGIWTKATTLPLLLRALDVQDSAVAQQRAAVCSFLELPAWEAAPDGLKTAVYAWLRALGPSERIANPGG